MKRNIEEAMTWVYVAAIAGASLYFAWLAHNASPKSRLNCSVAEISPDFTHADRQKCRLIRAGKL
jgi:hypothetical protein